MKYQKKKGSVISKISTALLALLLCMSLVMPMADMSVYANNEEASAAAEEIGTGYDAEGIYPDTYESETEADAEPAVTAITGYETSYNKRYNQELLIEADITPADVSEVQLQRYSSEEDSWTTILTAIAAPAADTEQVESLIEDETAASDAAYETSEDEAAASDAAYETSEDENAADTTDTTASPELGPATLTEENGVAHVTFNVPQEERERTSSTWRIYISAAENISEAYSDEITVTTRNLEKLSLSARTACVYRIDGDGEGTMIYSKHSTTEVAQASTTKLMTAVLLLESGLLDSNTRISAHAAETPYGSGQMVAGDIYRTKDLLYAMLLPSANDAATAVAERVGGTEGAFVNMMNAKAKELGLTQTHFCNPHGLDADGHYTTAYELAELTAYAYTFPEIRDCWATQYKAIKSLEKGRRWHLWSTNAIFGYISNFLGGKTGTEDNAGCCFTGVYTFNGDTYVTVVLGSGYGFSRWIDTKRLHGYIRDYATSRY